MKTTQRNGKLLHKKEALSNGDGAATRIYLREIRRVKRLTPRAEIDLAARARQGDHEAREQIIKANLRQVTEIAPEYEGFGLPLLDLISEGNLGLMKAVKRFDPVKGGSLATYSARWIKRSITRAVRESRQAVSLPANHLQPRKLGDRARGVSNRVGLKPRPVSPSPKTSPATK
jgi:RNA polymerase primary sigma factor